MDQTEVGRIVREQMVELKPLLDGIVQELAVRNVNMQDGGLAFLFMAAVALTAFHARSHSDFTVEAQDELLDTFRHMLIFTWGMEVTNRA